METAIDPYRDEHVGELVRHCEKNAFTTFQDKVCEGDDQMFLGEDNDWDE